MTQAKTIRAAIKKIPRGEPFTTASLRLLGAEANIRQVLSRMVKFEEITRVARGVYVKPEKPLPYLKKGLVPLPGVEEIVDVITNSTGEKIAYHGAKAANRFLLSTQVPMRPVYYTTGTTRDIRIHGMTVSFYNRSPRKLVAHGTKSRDVISALEYVGKKEATLEMISTILGELSEKEIKHLLNCVEYMPAWMADLFFQHQQMEQP